MTRQRLNNHVEQHYPKAISAPAFRNRLLQSLEEIGFDDPSKILLAVSLCSDDVNAVHDQDVTWARKHFSNHLLGPFELGGLAGFPFGGLTGISTIAHHVPDNGTALIIFGPHIGVDDEGRLGFLLRPGQHKISSACGALTLAVHRVLSDEEFPQTLDPDDLEQSFLVTQLSGHQQRIRMAQNPLKEATDILYEKIEGSILRYLKEKAEDFKVKEILIAGIVLINTGSDHEDYVDVRRLETHRFR
jgi:hypothetical protein